MEIMRTADHERSSPSSRRDFMVGATAAGIAALAAAPMAGAEARGSASGAPFASPCKLVSVLRRRKGLSQAEFNHYWLHHHGPHVARPAVQTLGAYRYLQNHRLDNALSKGVAAEKGQRLDQYDGIAEISFPSQAVLLKALGTAAGSAANDRLNKDELNFIDVKASYYFFAREYIFVDKTPH
jgi:hypothetical protein